MQIESKRVFRTGFVLKEADLRRFVDLIQEQFLKLSANLKSSGRFRLKLRNGALMMASSLDEVLSLENGGSTQIIRLVYEHQLEPADKVTFAHIEFINVDADDDAGYTSMRFHVNGENRDWVFVTSSLLEERCERVRRFAPNQIVGKGPSSTVYRLAFPLLTLLLSFGFLAFMLHSIDNRPKIGKLLEAAIQAGTIKEPVDAILFVEQQRDQEKVSSEVFPQKSFFCLCGLLLFVILMWLFFLRYYPVYNFCWGEYSEEFQRKESRRQFWLVIIIVGIVISFLGGILANNVGVVKGWFGP